jgi:hypothetical protein
MIRLNRVGLSVVSLAVLGTVLVFTTVHNSHKSPVDSINSRPKKASKPVHSTPQKETIKAPTQTIPIKKITTKQVTETQAIPFQTIEKTDSDVEKGQRVVVINGVNGSKTINYKVTYTGDQETAREKISENVITQPVNQVIKIGTYVPVTPSPPSGPAGATALCKDGSFSYAEHHQGACSKNGGVNIWYQ